MADKNGKTNKKADGAAERIRAYFEANASDDLKRRVAAEGKTAAGALAYAKEQARKLAVGGCACVDDETVYGWAMHYFEDEPAEKPAASAKKPAETAEEPAETAEETAEAAETEGDGAETRQDAPETHSAASAPESAQTDMLAALGL